MADQPAEAASHAEASPKQSPSTPPPPPTYSRWRTTAHLYFPLVTVALFLVFASFETSQGAMICLLLSAIPTNWFAALFYPADRPEPTPQEAIRFSRKSDIYRAAILFTYRWLYGTPFNLQFFVADLAFSYGLGATIGERAVGTKPRRSEFAAHLLWVAGSSVLMMYAPAFLSFWVTLVDRAIWRAAYIALVDDVVGILTRPNVKSWQGKVRLVLVQALVIFFTFWVLIRWMNGVVESYTDDPKFQAALAALEELNVEQEPVGMQVDIEDDGDRYLV